MASAVAAKAAAPKAAVRNDLQRRNVAMKMKNGETAAAA
jgi:hypothetical protein